MYRVFLFLAILAFCYSFPFTSSNIQKTFFNKQDDDTDLVDSSGAGYSFFKKQQIDVRPFAQPSSFDIPQQDLAAYLHSSAFSVKPNQNKMFNTFNQVLNQPSQNPLFNTANQVFNNAFGQQQLIPRPNIPVQNFLPNTVQIQQPQFVQKDFSQIPSISSSGYTGQQTTFPIQSKLIATNTYNNQPNILPAQNDLKIFSGYGNQQQDLSFVSQPQQTWNNQQKTVGFTSSYDGQGQQPVSSGFIVQSNQQNDQPFITNTAFISSQPSIQRFISQTQPKQQISNYGR